MTTETCVKCGAPLDDGAAFCTNCGAARPVGQESIITGGKCPNCGAILEPGAKFCVECGTTIDSTTDGVATQVIETPADELDNSAEESTLMGDKCPNCGAVMEQGAKFCVECGTTIGDTTAQPPEVSAPKPIEEPVAVTEPIATEEPADVDNKCPNCGAVLEPRAKFCVECGTTIDDVATISPEVSAPKPIEEPVVADDIPTQIEEVPEETSLPADASTIAITADTTVIEPDPFESTTDATSEPTPEPLDEPATEPIPEPVPTPTPEPISSSPNTGSITAAADKDKKKSKKGCIIGGCITLLVLGLIAAVIAAAIFILPNINAPDVTGGKTHTFDYMTEDEYEIWHQAPDGTVTNENDMAKVHNALMGINGSADSDYSVEVTVFFQTTENEDAWAGPVLRVNPGGGDRYAFQLFPEKKLVRIVEINNLGESTVYAEESIPQLEIGKEYRILAQTEGNDIFMALNDAPLLKCSVVSLIEGPIGCEASGCTVYFDDLVISKPQ